MAIVDPFDSGGIVDPMDSIQDPFDLPQEELQKTNPLEDAVIGLKQAGHSFKDVLDMLAGAAASYAGDIEGADKIYADMEQRNAKLAEELSKLDQGTAGKVISGLTQIVPMLAGGAVIGGAKGAALIPSAISALSGSKENVKAGANVFPATAQAVLETGADYASMRLPAGKTLLKGAGIGAGSAVGTEVVTDLIGQWLMGFTGAPEAAKRYEITPEKLAVSAAVGGIAGGGIAGLTPKVAVDTPEAKVLPEADVELVQQRDVDVPMDKAPELSVPSTAGRMREAIGEAGKQVGKGADYIFTPISTRAGKLHPEIQQALLDFETKASKTAGDQISEVDPLFTHINRLPKEQQAIVNSALKQNDYDALTKNLPDDVKPLVPELQKTLDNTWKNLEDAKVVTPEQYRKGFFPRMVKDLDGLYAYIGKDGGANILQERLKKAEAKHGSLTELEQAQIVSDYIQNVYMGRGKPGFTKKRGFEQLPQELEKFYYNPTETIHSYLRNAAYYAERNRFFGKDLVTDAESGKPDIASSIGARVLRLRNEGKISPEQVDELASILQTRFGRGQMSSNAFWQGVKDMTHVATLGSGMGTTVMQGADLVLTPFIDGLRPTLYGIAASLTSKNNPIRLRDFGILNHLSEEFISDRPTTKMANITLAPLGTVDRSIKTVILNSIQKSGQMAAKAGEKKAGTHYLYTDYQKRFGAEFPALIEDLKAGRRTELTDRFVISELAKRQPIFKSEYSQLYLDSPNIARPAMALSSFMLKTADLIKTRSYDQIVHGNRKAGIKNLALLATGLALGQVSFDSIRNFIQNKPIEDPEDINKIAASVAGIFRYNEYLSNDLQRGAFGDAAWKALKPAYITAFQPLWTDLVALMNDTDYMTGHPEGYKGNWRKFVPFVGKELYGQSEFGERRRQELEDKAFNKKLKEMSE